MTDEPRPSLFERGRRLYSAIGITAILGGLLTGGVWMYRAGVFNTHRADYESAETAARELETTERKAADDILRLQIREFMAVLKDQSDALNRFTAEIAAANAREEARAQRAADDRTAIQNSLAQLRQEIHEQERRSHP